MNLKNHTQYGSRHKAAASICRVPIMVLERTANPWSFIRLVGSNPTLCAEERVISFRASRTFVDLHLLSPLGVSVKDGA